MSCILHLLSSSGGHQTGSFMNLCIFILSDKCFWTRDTSDCLSLTAVSQCFLAQLCPCAPPLPSFITHSAWSHLKFPPESLPQLNDALLSEGNLEHQAFMKTKGKRYLWDNFLSGVTEVMCRGHGDAAHRPLFTLTESFSESGRVLQQGGTKVPNNTQPRCTRTLPACGGDAAKLIFKWYRTASRHLSRWSKGL